MRLKEVHPYNVPFFVTREIQTTVLIFGGKAFIRKEKVKVLFGKIKKAALLKAASI